MGAPAHVAGANDRVRVAIVGLRGRGEDHIHGFGSLSNVEIAALCDIDDNVMAQRLHQVQKVGFQPETYSDVRKLLENKTIDAVSICDAPSLARAHRHMGHAGRQGCLRRKAVLVQSFACCNFK